MNGLDGQSEDILRDGSSEKAAIKPLQVVRRLALKARENVASLFLKPRDAAVGIMVREGKIYALLLTIEEQDSVLDGEESDLPSRMVRRAVVRQIVHAKIRMDEGQQIFSAIAEEADVLLSRHGWNDFPLGVVLGKNMVQVYDIPLPTEIEEWKEAAYWELDDRLQQDGMRTESPELAYARDENGLCHVAVVDASDFRLLREAFRATGRRADFSAFCPRDFHEVDGGLLCGDDFLSFSPDALERDQRDEMTDLSATFAPAAAAGLAAVGRGRSFVVRFPSAEGERLPLQYKKMAAALVVLTAAVLIGMASYDAFALHRAEQEKAEVAARLIQMEGDRKSMLLLQKIRGRIDGRQKLLARLSESPSPVYSLLVHLGQPSLVVEGVWLDGMTFKDDGSVELEGKAYSFDLLADYIKGFERDGDFFQKPPLLTESSEQEEAGRKVVRFKLGASLRGD